MPNLNVVCGLDPMPDNKGWVDVRPKVPVLAVVNTENPLFKGSPYQMSQGSVFAADWNSDPTTIAAGSVVKLYAADGVTEVLNLPSGTDGFADVTYRQDQRYQIVMSGTGFADDGSDNGLTYGLTPESGTANTNGLDGYGNSGIMADSLAEDTNAYTFLASFKVPKPNNLGGVDKTLVEGKINPACHQAW